jgi:7,8-dihydropterin-6-yl-methyl-4-(beta-D-ribofuranosyl)aminobenzene 5'-phosphate synthase
MMKLTVLMDNTATLDKPYLAESGLSFLIETDDAKIIFDTGFSPLFLSNARKMGIDMKDITGVAISHGHNDHTNGLPSLAALLNQVGRRVPLVLHPGCLEKKWWRNKDGTLEDIGMPRDREFFESQYDIITADMPMELGENLYFLGEIPRTMRAANEPIGLIANQVNSMIPDFVQDDSAIVFDGKDGLVVINGCAHSGLVNILAYVKDLFPEKPIDAVVGGFHMLSKNPVWLSEMGENLKKYQPRRIYPCHCTDEASRAHLRSQFSVCDISVGSTFTFE